MFVVILGIRALLDALRILCEALLEKQVLGRGLGVCIPNVLLGLLLPLV